MELIEIVRNCTVANGNIIKLPDVQLDRADYLKVKKLFESNGGKWKGGKCQGFLFNTTDVTPILERLQDGDLSNRKKKFQFFETPVEIAWRLAVRLGDVEPSHRILEPSAGCGALVKAVLEEWPDQVVDCYELMEENRTELGKIPNARILGEDFLESEVGMYDRIIANPPFTNNQDITHVMKMWEHLSEGGQMAVIMSKHWQFASDKASRDFRSFIDTVDHDIAELPAGAFKESGTNIETVMVTLWK